MDNIVRLPSQQSVFNATSRLVDIVIPAGSGIYDLTETYVAIQVQVDDLELDTTTATAGALAQNASGLVASDAVADVRLNIKHNSTVASIYDTCAVPIECLVRNCSMMSSTRGKIEDIRRSDSLRGTMKAYTLDKEDVESRALVGFAGAAKTNPWASGRLARLVGVGTTPSTYQTHEVRIMLKDLFNIADMADALDTGIYGALSLHLELNLDRVQLQQALVGDDLFSRPYHNQPTPAAISGPANIEYKTATTITTPVGAGIVSDSIEMSAQYASLEDSPFFNNQMVQVTTTYTQAGAGTSAAKYPADGDIRWAVVKSIVWDKVSKRVTLNFGTGSEVYATGAVGVTELVMNMEVIGSALVSVADKLSFPTVELTAIRRMDLASGPSQIQYTQFQTISDQWQNATVLERSYYLPPQTTNAFIVMPSASGTGFSDILGCARVSDYRFTVNGESLTNRAVPLFAQATVNGAANDNKTDIGSALHYDLISKTFMNSGKRFASLMEAVYDQDIPMSTDRPSAGGSSGWLTLAESPTKVCYMLALPLPVSASQTQLTVSLQGNFPNSSGELHIFCEVRSVV
tara:strand:+ start:1947 stop:3671 length:1725 start_codon:yes stop_codon:yes gene_type:complete